MKWCAVSKSEEININSPLDMYQIRTSTILNGRFNILKIPIIILTLGTGSHQIIECTQMNTSNNAIYHLLKKSYFGTFIKSASRYN